MLRIAQWRLEITGQKTGDRVSFCFDSPSFEPYASNSNESNKKWGWGQQRHV